MGKLKREELASNGSKKKKDESDYHRDPLPESGPEWKVWRQTKKENFRKWKEEKLIKALEAEKAQKVSTAAAARASKSGAAVSTAPESSTSGRQWTLSVALAGSVLDIAQSAELRTYLAGQLARAMAVFCVDEVIVYDDAKTLTRNELGEVCVAGSTQALAGRPNGCMLLSKVLLYLECPQYLRKAFFPAQKELQYAGLLNPLYTPHHLQANEESNFREGIVLDKPVKAKKGSFVNIGLSKECQIDKSLQPGVRVTVNILDTAADRKTIKGKVVSPRTPLVESGLYWGYKVRLATGLSKVFSECPYAGGYDVNIAVTTAHDDKGKPVDNLAVPSFKHALVVFSGVSGFSQAIEGDDDVTATEVADLFDHVSDPCPGQGCRSLRTEEAVLVFLSALRSKLLSAAKLP